MKTAAVIQLVAGDLQGEAYTDAVRTVYDTITEVGVDATSNPADLDQITAAGGDLTLMPNADLTAAGVYAVRAAFAG